MILSIITVSEVLIGRTTRSVASRDYPRIGYIIIDGKTQPSVHWISYASSAITSPSSAKEKRHLRCHEPRGLTHATGNLVSFLGYRANTW